MKKNQPSGGFFIKRKTSFDFFLYFLIISLIRKGHLNLTENEGNSQIFVEGRSSDPRFARVLRGLGFDIVFKGQISLSLD